jgi:hypothetical protein
MSRKYSKLDVDLKQADLQMQKNYSKLQDLDKTLIRLSELEDILKSDPKREAYIKITKKRIGHLLLKMLERPISDKVEDLTWHAEMRGRLMEQVQHANALRQVEGAKGLVGRIKGVLLKSNESISAKIERQG